LRAFDPAGPFDLAASSMIVAVRSVERSASSMKPPQAGLSAGICVVFAQVPLVKSKKLSPGLTLLSMPAVSKPQAPNCGLPLAAAAGFEPCSAEEAGAEAAASASAAAPHMIMCLIILNYPHP
jgi:hypothetical protein